jgi:hypothetical protein
MSKIDLETIKTLLEIRSDFVVNYENNNFAISNMEYHSFLDDINIKEPLSKHDSLRFFKEIDLKFNELTKNIIEEETREVTDILNSVSIASEAESEGTDFDDTFQAQKQIIIENIQNNKVNFNELLEQERNDLENIKYKDFDSSFPTDEDKIIADLNEIENEYLINYYQNHIVTIQSTQSLQILDDNNISPPSSAADKDRFLSDLADKIRELEVENEKRFDDSNLYNLEIINGASFSVKTKLNQSLEIGNSIGIAIKDRLNFNAGTYRNSNLRVGNPRNTEDFTNISMRRGTSNSYNDIYKSFSQKTEKSYSYRFGSINSSYTSNEKLTHNSLINKYSYTKADYNRIFDYKGFIMSNTNRVYSFGLEYQNSIMYFGIGVMYVTWAPVQLSIWGYFSILRLVNLGHTVHALYSSGIDFKYVAKSDHEALIYKKFRAGELDTSAMKEYADVINKQEEAAGMDLGVVSKRTGKFILHNTSMQLTGRSERAIRRKVRKEARAKKEAKKAPTPGPDFAKATLSVFVYALIGAILGGLLGALIEKYSPKLSDSDDPNEPSGDDSSSSNTEDLVTGYQKVT